MPQVSAAPESSHLAAGSRARYGRWCAAIAGTWVASLLIGAALLYLVTQGTTRPLSPSRALFSAMNAGSLTGFSWNWGEPGDQQGVAATILGVTVLGLLAAWMIPYLGFLQLGLHVRNRSRDVAAGVARNRLYGLLIPLVAIALAAALAWMGGIAPASEGSSWWLATLSGGVNVLAGAGGSGMRLESQSAWFWVAAVPLHFLGLLGPLLAARWIAGGGLAVQFRLTLVAGAAAFLAAAGLLIATTGATTVDRLVQAIAMAIDARSSGFLEEATDLPRAGQMAVAPLPLLGGLSGVGGGLKVVTAAVLVLGVARLLRGKRVGRVAALAGLWVGFLGVVAFLTLLALIALMPDLPVDRLWMLACGATGNVALSIDPVVAAGADGYVLAATMLLSRLGGWVVLWLSVRMATRPAVEADMGPEPVVLG